jgi:hypothetical protein
MGLIILFIIVILAIGIPITVLYFLYKWLAKKGQKKIGVLLLTVILGYMTYSIYTAFYPLNEFYEYEFEHNSGLDFPKTGIIIDKNSNFPDQHGDYWASAIIAMDTEEFEILKTNLLNQKGFQIDTTRQGMGITKDYRELTKAIDKKDIEIVYLNTDKEWFKVAFLKNKKTIIFERSSS